MPDMGVRLDRQRWRSDIEARRGRQTWTSDVNVRPGRRTCMPDMGVRPDYQAWRSDIDVRHRGQTCMPDMGVRPDRQTSMSDNGVKRGRVTWMSDQEVPTRWQNLVAKQRPGAPRPGLVESHDPLMNRGPSSNPGMCPELPGVFRPERTYRRPGFPHFRVLPGVKLLLQSVAVVGSRAGVEHALRLNALLDVAIEQLE